MRKLYGVLNTDEVNLQNICVPIEALTSSLEYNVKFSLRNGLPLGVPSHIGHDMHRPLGWCTSTGILVSKDSARQIGSVVEGEDQDEKEEIEQRIDRFRAAFAAEGVGPFEASLRERLSNVDLRDAKLIQCEAAAIVRAGLAVELYPRLFKEDLGAVDKDGLVDFRTLLSIATQVKPGIFHDKQRDLLLFAHPFFRRSLSRRNSLNVYFFRRFTACGSEHPELRTRLRLDPDMIGYPESALHILEFEHWRGPKFSKDIKHLASGLTEYKADDDTMHYEGVSKTQFWWKGLETRKIGNKEAQFRVLEAEELIENSSQGISDQHFGCRYVHAEFSAAENLITHFDGAIRAYSAEPYLARIDTSLDRSGKNTDYTKLFRFDGPLSIREWQELANDYYRGNPTISEYFGAEADETVLRQPNTLPRPDLLPAQVFQLMALLSFHPQKDIKELAILCDAYIQGDGSELSYIELPSNQLQQALRDHIDINAENFIRAFDKKLNFPHLFFPARLTLQAEFEALTQQIDQALAADIEAGQLEEISFCFEWPNEGLSIRLALAGDARCVQRLMRVLHRVIKCSQSPKNWMGQLKAEIIRHVDLCAIDTEPRIEVRDDGKLRVLHYGDAELHSVEC